MKRALILALSGIQRVAQQQAEMEALQRQLEQFTRMQVPNVDEIVREALAKERAAVAEENRRRREAEGGGGGGAEGGQEEGGDDDDDDEDDNIRNFTEMTKALAATQEANNASNKQFMDTVLQMMAVQAQMVNQMMLNQQVPAPPAADGQVPVGTALQEMGVSLDKNKMTVKAPRFTGTPREYPLFRKMLADYVHDCMRTGG